MLKPSKSLLAAALIALAGLSSTAAQALTRVVSFEYLTSSATVLTPMGAGDSLLLDTLVTTEVGALNQQITFTIAPGVSLVSGNAAWEVNPAAGTGPRLTGVNIDIVDSANNVVASDSFLGVLGNFAHSNWASVAIAPGTYTLKATGTGVRDSRLDVTLNFASPVPEPSPAALLLSGMAILGFLGMRRGTRR